LIEDLMKQARIASPCSANWDEMPGDEKMRLCGQCNKHVLNAIEMTDEEVLQAFARIAAGQRVCMQLYRRADGTFLTKDCPVGFKKLQAQARKAISRVAAVIAGGLSLLLSLAAGTQSASAQTVGTGCGAGKTKNGKPVWHSTIQTSDAGARAAQAKAGNTTAPVILNAQPNFVKGEMVMTPRPTAEVLAARKAVLEEEKESGTESTPCAVKVLKLASLLFASYDYDAAQECNLRILRMTVKNKDMNKQARQACQNLADIAGIRGDDKARQSWLARINEFAPEAKKQ
jgi:hypothetical protein